MNGDVYIWTDNALSRVVKNVHVGPVFSMFTTVKDGLIVTGGKDKGYVSYQLLSKNLSSILQLQYKSLAGTM